jgi:hypothetical protein
MSEGRESQREPGASETAGPDREFLIEEWKSTQKAAEQFNDLGLRVRVFGIGGVFLIAGYGVQAIKHDKVLLSCRVPWLSWNIPLQSSALMVLMSLVLLAAVYFIDLGYYSAMLLAAVIYAQQLEWILRNGKEIIDEGGLARIDNMPFPTERDLMKRLPNSNTHIYGKTCYISYYTSVVSTGLRSNLAFAYFVAAGVLLEAFLVLNFRPRPTLPAIGAIVLLLILWLKFIRGEPSLSSRGQPATKPL